MAAFFYVWHNEQMVNFSSYFEAVRFLEGLINIPAQDYLKDRSNPEIYIKRMRFLLNALGNPDRGMKYIHISGTAGKGTVANMVHSGLVAAGKKAGLFTSPFIISTIEKIKVGDLYISPQEFVSVVNKIKPVLDEVHEKSPYGSPSYFEIILAVAFIYFRKKKCEWVVLEVGLGGSFDATNVIERPRITAITNIDRDHTHILGKTLIKIARDKGGIIKKDSLFLTTESRPHLTKIFQEICRRKKSDCEFINVVSGYRDRNKALAQAILERVGISLKYISRGISNARMPGRFEIIDRNPLVILDGAHSPVKIKGLIEDLGQISFDNLYLIFGVANNKEYKEMIGLLLPLARKIFATRFEINERKCAPPGDIKEVIKKISRKEVEVFLDPMMALDKSLRIARKNDLILATGSLFLVSRLRRRWYPEEVFLKTRKAFK